MARPKSLAVVWCLQLRQVLFALSSVLPGSMPLQERTPLAWRLTRRNYKSLLLTI